MTNEKINKRFLNMSLSVLFDSDHSSLNKGGDLDHSPGDLLSTAIDRLQQESVGLTNHIIEFIRAQSNDDQSVMMIQELRNETTTLGLDRKIGTDMCTDAYHDFVRDRDQFNGQSRCLICSGRQFHYE
jgi:hypothetical protein